MIGKIIAIGQCWSQYNDHLLFTFASKVVVRRHSWTCSLDVAKQEPFRYPLASSLSLLCISTDLPQGKVFVNGLLIDSIKDWYIANTGYILQLATPYYEELTVRENLTLAAQIKLPNTFTLKEKFIRIEQVLAVVSAPVCACVWFVHVCVYAGVLSPLKPQLRCRRVGR